MGRHVLHVGVNGTCPHVLPSFCGSTMVHKWHYASSFTLAESFRFGLPWGFKPFKIVFSNPSRLSKTYRRSKWQAKLINNTCFEKTMRMQLFRATKFALELTIDHSQTRCKLLLNKVNWAFPLEACNIGTLLNIIFKRW